MKSQSRRWAGAVCAAFLAAPILALPAAAQSVYPTGTTVWDPEATWDGYTLFAAQGGFAVLIDMDGTVVHRWDNPVPGHYLSNVEPLEAGRILAFSFDPTVEPQRRRDAFELDWFNRVVWSYPLAGYPPDVIYHHDIERLPNGNTLFLLAQNIDVPSISPLTLRDDFLGEVDPNGTPQWRWDTYEHFDEFEFPDDSKALIAANGGDWAHANSISVIPPNGHTQPELAEGNIIVSQRFTNTIFIIDKESGAIVWKLGPEGHLTFGQHWPHMIRQGLPGAGNILVFDNGSGTGYPLRRRAPGRSRVLEIDPVTRSVVWVYEDWMKFWSNIVSGAQRLPNGNTLICSGVKGRLFEVTVDGEIVWEYLSPWSSPPELGGRSLVYRAYRLPYTWAPAKPHRRPEEPLVDVRRELR